VALLLVVGTGVTLLGSIFTAPIGLVLAGLPAPPGVQLAIVYSSAFAGLWLGLLCWVRFVERRPFRTIGLQADRPVWRYLAGAALGVGMFSAVVGLLALAGAAVIDGVRFDGATVASLFALAVGYSVQGSGEEALVRGWLLPVAAVRFGVVGGMIAQTFMFTLLHGVNPGITPLAVLNLALVSLFLGVWALRAGDIWPIMGWHAAWNWAQGTVFGIAVSGSPPADALLPVSLTGPDWLAGGVFGAEASVITSVVLGAGLAVTLLREARRRTETS
jgi:membrane protease YdiL (CAAX protease family)